MTACRLFLLLLLIAGPAHAQYTRVEAPLGRNGSEGTLNLFLFDSRNIHFKIIDQGGMEKQRFENLGAAMKAHRCLAGCNGGFFGTDGNPLGLVIADGKTSGRKNLASSLASGVLYLGPSGPRLARAKAYFQKQTAPPQHLLQTGPLLVEGGKIVDGLSTRRTARRTFIFTDGGHRWGIGTSPATTLHQLATALADPGTFKGFNIATALNLDGGSSSAFWVKREHGPLYLKEIRKVRNFVGLVRR